MGIDKLLAIEVDHCPQSFGCLLYSKEIGNILYSGDTRYCPNLINYAQKAKLLIHEASLHNGAEEVAYKLKHCTSN